MRNRRVLAICALVLAAVVPAGAQQAGGDPVLAMKTGRGLFEKSCKLCHALDRSLATNRDAQAWEQTVKRMVAYGAPLNAGQRTLVVRYLAARAAFAGSCAGCHELTRVVSDKPGARDWKALAERMAGHVRELEKQGKAAAGGSFSPEKLADIAALLQVVIP